ncbi:MAG: hypothetical protein H0T45_17595, partial [Pyrinomonadaceae bacterium]|nr:hypothetical protein [Pyrinomonadaceae bacterium]
MSHLEPRAQTRPTLIESIHQSHRQAIFREVLLTTSQTAFDSSEFSNPNLEPLFTGTQIQARVAELGAQVARDYAGRNPLLLGVLKGACVFLSDLVRATDLQLGLEFIAISSYGAATRTSGEVRIVKDLDVPIEGRDIL